MSNLLRFNTRENHTAAASRAIAISPRQVLALLQHQAVFAINQPDPKIALRHLLFVLREQWSFFGHDFCRDCENGMQPDGSFEHAPDCPIGYALRAVED